MLTFQGSRDSAGYTRPPLDTATYRKPWDLFTFDFSLDLFSPKTALRRPRIHGLSPHTRRRQSSPPPSNPRARTRPRDHDATPAAAPHIHEQPARTVNDLTTYPDSIPDDLDDIAAHGRAIHEPLSPRIAHHRSRLRNTKRGPTFKTCCMPDPSIRMPAHVHGAVAKPIRQVAENVPHVENT